MFNDVVLSFKDVLLFFSAFLVALIKFLLLDGVGGGSQEAAGSLQEAQDPRWHQKDLSRPASPQEVSRRQEVLVGPRRPSKVPGGPRMQSMAVYPSCLLGTCGAKMATGRIFAFGNYVSGCRHVR